MFDYTEDHYRETCSAGSVAMEISTIEERRTAVVRQFWMFLIGGLALATVIVLMTGVSGITLFVAIIVAVVGLVVGIVLVGGVGDGLKRAALETLAGKGGLSYMGSGFDPPVYPDARKALFGSWLSSQTFTDLFHGTDPDGRRFAFYEGRLTRRQGKNSVTVFSGQMYAWQRRTRSGGEVVIVPDRGLFNFFKPLSGMQRVKFEGDAEFERRFEVYAYEPAQAQMLLDADARRILLELRQSGRTFGYIGPEDAFVAATGGDRYEAGSMFKSLTGEQRVRIMFDDLCGTLNLLRRLRAAID